MARTKRFIPLCPVIALLVTGTVILVVGIALNPIFIDILHSEFKKLIPLTSTSSTLSTWEDPRESVDMYMKFYFFDVQNAEEVANGGKPRVKQIGPYTYQEIKIKKDVKFDTEDSTVSFISPRSWVFNESRSVGNENDTFTTINVPLLAVVTMLKEEPAFEFIISLAISSGLIKNEPTFKRLSVYELLWGYKDPIMSDASILLNMFNISLPMPMDGYFGFFYQKNNTDDGVYQVKTGQDGLNEFMQITEWNHNSSLPYWKTKYCNMINGTDGTMYHPFIEKSEKLSIFSSDLCRSIDVVYNSKHYLQDIPQYRFKPPQSLFDYPPKNPDSACYCVGDTCPRGGVLNISACQHGAPVFVSQPHFLNGDYYLSTVDGLNPNETIHNTFIDVEPTTGIVMQGAKRLQMNLAIEKFPNVKELSKLPTLLFPLLWLEEGALINSKGLATFKDMFFNVQHWVTFSSWLLIAVGALILVLTLAYVAIKYYSHRKSKKVTTAPDETTHLISGKTTPANNEPQAPGSASDPDKDWSKMMRDE